MENQKNLFGLIKSFYLLLKIDGKFRLKIIGKGSQKQKLIDYSKALKVDKYIEFKNFSKPDKYLKKEGIFILNSFFEGLPNILIEAMQFKIPIISTDCKSGPREILKNGIFGYLVNVNDPNGLAKKINLVSLEYKKALKNQILDSGANIDLISKLNAWNIFK